MIHGQRNAFFPFAHEYKSIEMYIQQHTYTHTYIHTYIYIWLIVSSEMEQLQYTNRRQYFHGQPFLKQQLVFVKYVFYCSMR